MHKLLARQVRRHLGARDLPADLGAFLAEVDAAYVSADRDRALLERSLELTSSELVERNRLLEGDLTRVDRIRAELVQREGELRSFLDGAPSLMGIAELLPDDVRFAVANPAVGALFGADVVGRSLIELRRPPDEIEAWLCHLRGATRVHGPVRDQPDLPTPQGSRCFASVVLDVSEGDAGVRVLFVMDDVTERRNLEVRLDLADRLASIGRLAAGVAHEINNPLANIVSNLEVVSDRLAALDLARTNGLDECLVDARAGAERVRRIVRDLKQLSRPDEETLEEIDVSRLLESTVKVAAHEIRHRAELVRQFEPVTRVFGNAARLSQVFLNLIVNAAQAIPVGRVSENRIVLRTRMAGPETLAVDVEDTGTGIPPEALSKLFDPFFTTKPIGEGSGIGLTICQGIVTDLGGRISVASQLGRGTTFTVELPAPRRSPIVGFPTAARPPSASRPGSRILVVDDEVAIGRVLVRLLSDQHVVAETTARAALDRLDRGERFDLLLCDMMMPEMTGLDLCDELERRGGSLARNAILMTGGLFSGDAAALAGRSNTVIEKPFDSDLLRELVARGLHDRASTPEPATRSACGAGGPSRR